MRENIIKQGKNKERKKKCRGTQKNAVNKRYTEQIERYEQTYKEGKTMPYTYMQLDREKKYKKN